MKIFGYTSTQEIQPAELREVTLCASPTELRALSAFLIKCAEEIEATPNDWEHVHYPGDERLAIDNFTE